MVTSRALSNGDTASNSSSQSGNHDPNHRYVLHHTREPQILQELRDETARCFPRAAHMAVGPEEGSFLAWLVATMDVHRAIEVGVFTGYSSLAMAMALPPHGKLVACDRDPVALEIAKKYWARAQVTEKIEVRLGPAVETLRSLLEGGGGDQFDLAFIDADKRSYKEYYELLLKLVRPGGVIAIDNVLWYGKVADESVNDKTTLALRELNDFLVTDERVDLSMLPLRDGLTLCRRRAM